MAHILVVDDDVASCRTLAVHLGRQGHEVEVAHDVERGLEKARGHRPDLVILDIRMPGRSGLEGLPEFKAIEPAPRVIMITAFHDIESTIAAMQRGAEEYIHKPIDLDELDEAVAKLVREAGGTMTTGEGGEEAPLTMVGRSRAMKEVFKAIGRVAKTPATVLITGESGTGKELVARAIHRAGHNPDGPFVVVNYAALVETLLESEMFGHEKGAFTGAVGRQVGKFALADGGTIFLDEIAEMPPSMQAKLLRVLQYKEFTPLGARQTQRTNARVIAATNVDLCERVAAGAFRADLYYRLQVVNIHLPPLRERREDLRDLVRHLLRRLNRELNRRVTHVAEEALACFERYPWPGNNVRELENVLMKAIALSAGDTITVDLLPPEIRGSKAELTDPEPGICSLSELERRHVARVLDHCNWHRGRACEILGISRPRLRRMIRNFGLQPPSGRPWTDEEEDDGGDPPD